jgi:hypothetical protein
VAADSARSGAQRTGLSARALTSWLLRLLWFGLPLVTGSVLADALGSASRPVQIVASTGLWTGWAVVLAATLVPRTVTLTVLRTVAPAAAAAVGAAVAVGDEAVGWRLAALVWVLATLGLAFAPGTGQAFVDGSSYGDEQRFPLRIPGPVLAGPVELVWLVVASGVVAGPLLLAAKQWVVGVVVLAVGWPAAWWGAQVLHGLSRRWVVLVPAGLVLHDPLALADPILVRRSSIASFGPAPAETDALDLTRGALGLALEVRLTAPATFTVSPTSRRAATETIQVERALFTPSRPGALLAAARARRLG